MNIFKWLARRRIHDCLKKYRLPYRLWAETFGQYSLFSHLSSVEKARLRRLTTQFLQNKQLNGARGIVVNGQMSVLIAAQAVLPILNLGLDYYRGWTEIIVYPSNFRVRRESTDGNGLVSQENRLLSGEAWSQGPLILSWDEVQEDLRSAHPGHNVVIHEFAHKLDMLNGVANGMPPLHADMPIPEWTAALSRAFDILQRKISLDQSTRINAYAASNPAEYFAVVSEYFFTAPDILHQHCTDVYRQLVGFYKQDPLSRRF